MAFPFPAVINTFVQQTTAAAARQSIGVYIVQSASQTITMSGAFTLGITLTGNTALTFPTGGTLVTTASLISDLAATTSAALMAKISDETGSGGGLVFATGPTLSAPTLTGNTTVTTVNKVALTAPATLATLALADGSTLTTSGAFATTLTFTAPTTVSFPITGLLYGTRAASITSAQLLASLTNPTGSGLAVFATAPSMTSATIAAYTFTGTGTIGAGCTLTTPVIGAATGTSLVLSGALTSPTIGTASATAFVGATIVLGGAGTVTCGAITASDLRLTSGGIRHNLSPRSTSPAALSTAAGIEHLTYAGVGAFTMAAPSAIDGQEVTIINGSNNAHVVTFTGSTLYDGTAGANLTVTFAAFIGAAITVVASGSIWLVKNYHAVTIAP